MKKFTITENRFLSSDVFLLTLKAQRSQDALMHTPGQYAAISFKVNGRPTPARCFSIVSAPNNQGILQFAIKLSGDFTHTAAGLQAGAEVMVQGPFGEFVVDRQYDRNIVMLAGGIGITPFISMIRHSATSRSPIPITLLYSCQSQKNIPFFDELVEIASTNKHINVITDGAATTSLGAQIFNGRINEAVILNATRGKTNASTYFMCGPAGFMNGMHDILIRKGVFEENIVSEAFTQGATGRAAQANKATSRSIYTFAGAALVLGVAFIMLLDVVRAVPKIAAADAAQIAQVQSTATPAATPTASATPDTSSTYTYTTQATATPTAVPTPVATPYTQTYTYRQPVTSVS